MALKLYTFPGNPRANKALIAAKYNGIDITIPAGFVMGETNRTPEFLALNPLGKVPTLETPEGGIFESNAIARYGVLSFPSMLVTVLRRPALGGGAGGGGHRSCWPPVCLHRARDARQLMEPIAGGAVAGLRADSQLLGGSYFESVRLAVSADWVVAGLQSRRIPVYMALLPDHGNLRVRAQGQVSMWMDFTTTHVDLPVSNWVYQILGWMQYNPQITKKAQQDVLAALKVVDGHLLNNSFLVGSSITLADITLVCSLDLAYRMVREMMLTMWPATAQPHWRHLLAKRFAALRTVPGSRVLSGSVCAEQVSTRSLGSLRYMVGGRCVQVFSPDYRSKFPNVTRWFTTCVNQPEFVAIMGEVTLCEKMMEAAAPKKEKKAQAPKKEKAKKAPAPVSLQDTVLTMLIWAILSLSTLSEPSRRTDARARVHDCWSEG
jgi:glutathione S-transferase